MTKTLRPLGENQIGVLQSLGEHNSYPSGWIWGTHSQTERILDSLVKRGLVVLTETPSRGGGALAYMYPQRRWTLSDAGLALLRERFPQHHYRWNKNR